MQYQCYSFPFIFMISWIVERKKKRFKKTHRERRILFAFLLRRINVTSFVPLALSLDCGRNYSSGWWWWKWWFCCVFFLFFSFLIIFANYALRPNANLFNWFCQLRAETDKKKYHKILKKRDVRLQLCV